MREVQARKEALARQQAIEEQRRQEKFAAQEKRREIITRKFNIINAIAVVSWILLDFLALVGIDIGWAFYFFICLFWCCRGYPDDWLFYK